MAVPQGIDLNALQVFAAVAAAGGFTAAAGRVGMAKGQVSVHVRRLEAALGTALFTRTTRQVVLTEAGQALYEGCAPLLAELDAALGRIASGGAALAGTLRVSTSVDHAVQSLAPALARFAALHPGVHVDLRTADRVVDMVREGVDLSIRLGWLRDSSQRALKLGEFAQWVVAAPAYLRRAGHPETPGDLVGHAWVALTLLPTPLTWAFSGGEGAQTVQVQARLKADSPAALRAFLLAGAGLSVLDERSVAADVAAGRLLRVLPAYALRRGGIYAVLPPGQHVPARVRAFIEFYRAELAAASSAPAITSL